jgi:hypothetical protein
LVALYCVNKKRLAVSRLELRETAKRAFDGQRLAA